MEVTFTRPVKRILAMLFFLGVVGAVVGYLSAQIIRVFLANPELNALIGVVFVIGVLVAFWQVFRLFSAVNWLEALAARSRGIENVPPPGLLVAMDPLRKSGSARAMGASSARSILDSVSSRIDESRDTLRYISGLLIFLGLLGTFWGLSKVVPALVENINQISGLDSVSGVPGEGPSDRPPVLDLLLGGLRSQLDGMGIAFASSLLGLAGSLVVGFLELMSAGAQTRFYGELETWLSTVTRITNASEGEAGGVDGELVEQISYVHQQMASLNRIIAESEDRRSGDSAKIAEAISGLEKLAGQAVADRETIAQTVSTQSRTLAAVERLAENGGGGAGGDGLDAETRRHIRNIDVLLARLIEETATGRLETAEALRREMRAVGRAVSDVSQALGGGRNGG